MYIAGEEGERGEAEGPMARLDKRKNLRRQRGPRTKKGDVQGKGGWGGEGGEGLKICRAREN